MRLIKNYQKFLLKEDIEMIEEPEIATEGLPMDINMEVDDSEQISDMTLYRLTSHPVVDLSAPGEFYFSKLEDVNPDFLENRESNELFLITVTCPSVNVDKEKSEQECAKHNCECIVVVKDDSQCEVVKVEPFQK
jgi:hypothetical protein